MFRFPIPYRMVRNIYEIKPEDLKVDAIRLLLVDLDNTMAPYHEHAPSSMLKAWVDSMKEAGIEIFILSNNRGPRPSIFAKALGVEYASRAKKPSTKVLNRVVDRKRLAREQVMLVGDQIYTDMLCAARAYVRGICVKPICLRRNPLHAIRYFAEFPFRLAYKEEKS